MSRKRNSVMDDLWSDFDDSKYASKASGGFKSYARCYESHPAMPLPGTDLVIYGGSCINPSVHDADVYIGFDHSMQRTQRAWPWKKGTEFLFKITDMRAPDNAGEFTKLVNWTRKQLEAGLKVHCGCIGGHGRTGTFLAALVASYGEQDAITYVRENYCHKAVESTEQIKFLKEHYGITPAPGSKSHGGTRTTKKTPSLTLAPKPKPTVKSYSPITGPGSIW